MVQGIFNISMRYERTTAIKKWQTLPAQVRAISAHKIGTRRRQIFDTFNRFQPRNAAAGKRKMVELQWPPMISATTGRMRPLKSWLASCRMQDAAKTQPPRRLNHFYQSIVPMADSGDMGAPVDMDEGISNIASARDHP